MTIYTLALIIHLFCAIIFIGFVFADVVVLPAMKNVLDTQTLQKVKTTISNRARKIFPPSVLVLILSGGFMLSKYMNSQVGFFNSALQQLLMIKIILATLIVAGIVYSLSCKLFKKQPAAFMQSFHSFVLAVGIIIIILAKVMFVI